MSTGVKAIEIRIPRLPGSATAATLARWHVGTGDRIVPGDVIAEIAAGRDRIEIEAESGGRLERILHTPECGVLPVGTAIALIAPLEESPGVSEEIRNSPRRAESAAARPATRGVTSEARDRPARPASGETAAPGTARASMRDALRSALIAEMRADDSVLVLGEGAGDQGGAYKVMQGLRDLFGARRVVDTPLALQGVAGMAIGAAFAGLRPVVELRNFSLALQIFEQLVQSAAKAHYMTGGTLRCPVVFRGPTGLVPRSGAQHSQDVAAMLARIPGLSVVQPSNAADAKGLLRAAIRDPGPVVFLEHEVLYGKDFPAPLPDTPLPDLGRARLARAGDHVTIAAIGLGVLHALEAADRLAADGIEAEVIDLRSLRPLDHGAVIASVRKTGRCVTVEEGSPVASIGDHLAATLMREAFDHLDAPVLSCTNADVPMPYAANLESRAQVGVADVVAAARAVTYR